MCSLPKISIALKAEFRQWRSQPYVNLIRWCLFLARLNYQPQQTQPPHGPTQKIVHTGVLRLIAELCAATEQYFNYNSVYLETGIIMRRTRFPTVHTLNTSKHTKVCLLSVFLIYQSWFVSLIHLSYRQVSIFRMASLAFTAVGWQTECRGETSRAEHYKENVRLQQPDLDVWITQRFGHFHWFGKI